MFLGMGRGILLGPVLGLGLEGETRIALAMVQDTLV